MRRWFTRLVVLTALGAVVAAVFTALEPEPVEVEVVRVGRGDLRVTVEAEGRTRVLETFVIAAPVSGRIERIDLDPGDPVSPGGVPLVRIVPPEAPLLDPRSRAEARARLDAAHASVRRVESQVGSARAALTFAESEHDRFQELRSRGAVSKERLQEVELNLQTRRAELDAARFAVQVAGFQRDLATVALESAFPGPEASARPIEILSPVRGKVLRVHQESERFVTAGTPLLELGDPGRLEVVIDVLSRDAVRIATGATVLLDDWGGPGALAGTVRVIEPAAFTKISALGVEEQRVNVIASLRNDDAAVPLGDGYRVQARIVVWEGHDLVKIPTSALFRNGGTWAVFVVEEQIARNRSVTLGQQSEREAEVLAGLWEGETVILYPGDRIRSGARVAIVVTVGAEGA